jgi:hypothetical protein
MDCVFICKLHELHKVVIIVHTVKGPRVAHSQATRVAIPLAPHPPAAGAARAASKEGGGGAPPPLRRRLSGRRPGSLFSCWLGTVADDVWFNCALDDDLADPAGSPLVAAGMGGGVGSAWWSDMAGRRRAATGFGGGRGQIRSQSGARRSAEAAVAGGCARWQRLQGRGQLERPIGLSAPPPFPLSAPVAVVCAAAAHGGARPSVRAVAVLSGARASVCLVAVLGGVRQSVTPAA